MTGKIAMAGDHIYIETSKDATVTATEPFQPHASVDATQPLLASEEPTQNDPSVAATADI